MKAILVLTLFAVLTSCSSESSPTDGNTTAGEGGNGDTTKKTGGEVAVCAILKEIWSAELLGVEATAVEFKENSRYHPMCMASWKNPDADEDAYRTQMTDHMTRKMQAKASGKPFDESMPTSRPHNSVSLTFAKNKFRDSADAVTALEGVLAQLNKRIEVNSGERDVKFQASFEPAWIDGLGDRAAWSPKRSQVSLAAKAKLMHVVVKVSDDAAENRRIAIALARTLIESL